MDGAIVTCDFDQEKVSVVSQCPRCGWEFCDDHAEDADHDCTNVENKPGFTPTRGPLAGVRTPDKPRDEDESESESESSSDSDRDTDEEEESKDEKSTNPIKLAAAEAARRL